MLPLRSIKPHFLCFSIGARPSRKLSALSNLPSITTCPAVSMNPYALPSQTGAKPSTKCPARVSSIRFAPWQVPSKCGVIAKIPDG